MGEPDGAAFFLGNVPVVALSLRYNRLDCYWFNLCHELNHIIHGKRHSYLDFELNNPEAMAREGDEVEERAANQHARNWLLDHDAYTGFVKLTQPFFRMKRLWLLPATCTGIPVLMVCNAGRTLACFTRNAEKRQV